MPPETATRAGAEDSAGLWGIPGAGAPHGPAAQRKSFGLVIDRVGRGTGGAGSGPSRSKSGLIFIF